MTRSSLPVGTIASTIFCTLLLLSIASAIEATTNADWRKRFNEVYRLDNNEVLCRVAPPLIPERNKYYIKKRPPRGNETPRLPISITFHWNGELQYWGEVQSTIGNRPLAEVLRHTLGLTTFEFEGPEDLLELNVPGDWILRKDASQEDKLHALETILNKDFGRHIRFVRRQVNREVIIARGQFHFNPPTGTYDDRRVHIYADILIDKGGIGSSKLSGFLRKIGDCLNFPVVDETQKEGRGGRVHWALHRDARYAEIEDEDRMATVKKVLVNVAKQSSLEFTIERRLFNVWIVTDQEALTNEAKEAGVEILPFPQIGSPYEFALTTVEGQIVDSKALRGKVLLVDCWATWCWPCLKKMPRMKELYARLHSQDLEIIGVGFDTDEDTMKEAVKSLSLPWPQVMVPNEPSARELWHTATGISSIPRCLVVDRQGILQVDCKPQELEQELTRIVGLKTKSNSQ